MEELSLHILDIVQNSISADAKHIRVEIVEDDEKDLFTILVEDDGCGMTEEMVNAVTDPFTTGRKTRRVGLGIPLLKHACEQTGGKIEISSQLGKGTTLKASFGYSHIDRQPLGDIASTMHQLIVFNENVDFVYLHKVDANSFTLDTTEIRKILGDVSFKENEVSMWLLDYIVENEGFLYISDGKDDF